MKSNKQIKNFIDNLQVGDEVLGLEVTEIELGLYTLDDVEGKTFFIKTYDEIFDMIYEKEFDLQNNQ